MYAYCIGQCGIKPDEFWALTEAETMGIIAGHQIEMSETAANFRNIFVAILKLFSKENRSAKQLWPLPTDFTRNSMSMEDRYKLYSKIIENNNKGGSK